MTNEDSVRKYELEESAQGSDLFRAPGSELQQETARDQAEASGWIPQTDPDTWPSRLTRAKKQHLSLRDAMSEMVQAVGRPVGRHEWARLVDEALVELEEALTDHIEEVEATNGLLADIAEHSPRLGVEAGSLKQEHDVLRHSLEQARGPVRATETAGRVNAEQVRRRVVALLGRLMLHRHRAADLVYEAYNVDIAAGD